VWIIKFEFSSIYQLRISRDELLVYLEISIWPLNGFVITHEGHNTYEVIRSSETYHEIIHVQQQCTACCSRTHLQPRPSHTFIQACWFHIPWPPDLPLTPFPRLTLPSSFLRDLNVVHDIYLTFWHGPNQYWSQHHRCSASLGSSVRVYSRDQRCLRTMREVCRRD
jgi:hypothetical protein